MHTYRHTYMPMEAYTPTHNTDMHMRMHRKISEKKPKVVRVDTFLQIGVGGGMEVIKRVLASPAMS